VNPSELLNPQRQPDETHEQYRARRANANRYVKQGKMFPSVHYDSGVQFGQKERHGPIFKLARGKPAVNPKRLEKRVARGR
jgi:hypothetical protein